MPTGSFDSLSRQWKEHSSELAEISGEQLPVSAESPTEAALLAQEHLSQYLALPDDALVDLDDIDAADEARAWGQTSWRAFRVLHAYGEALASGKDPRELLDVV
jgi:hypothetical protein